MLKEINYSIVKSTKKNKKDIDDAMLEFNKRMGNLTQESIILDLNYVVKDTNGNILAGINADMYFWNILFIDTLWVDEKFRHKGIGSELFKKVENEAKKHNCHLIHLYTFDYQAKDFYLKMDFEIFGVLEDSASGRKIFYLKKSI